MGNPSSQRPWLIKSLFYPVLGLLLLSQFNNCGAYQDPSTSSELGSLGITCDNAACITPNLDHLNVKANLPSVSTNYDVAANVGEFNIGGDCNEGGFADNIIRWELYYNNARVRDSGMTGMILSSPSASVNSRCINGRFLLYVNLFAIPQDNVNRQGLWTGSARSAYDLYIEIMVRNKSTEIYQRNSFKGRTRVILQAI